MIILWYVTTAALTLHNSVVVPGFADQRAQQYYFAMYTVYIVHVKNNVLLTSGLLCDSQMSNKLEPNWRLEGWRESIKNAENTSAVSKLMHC